MNQLPPDRYLDVNGVRTRYWMVGEQGTPILLVHGILRFAEDWIHNIEALAQNHRVYVVDLVGYGCTDKPDIDYTQEEFVIFLKNFMEILGLHQVTAIGHSMGGGILTNLAYHHPDKVARMVLVASAGLGKEVHYGFRLGTLPWLPQVMARPNRLIISRAFKDVVYNGEIISPAVVEEAYQRFYLPGARNALLKTIRSGLTLRGIKREILDQVRQALPSLSIPILIIWGRQDNVVPLHHAHTALEHLPNAQLYVMEECGHFPMFEHPRTFNRLVDTFLACTEAAVRPELLVDVGAQQLGR